MPLLVQKLCATLPRILAHYDWGIGSPEALVAPGVPLLCTLFDVYDLIRLSVACIH